MAELVDIEQRLLSRVDKLENGCWLWKGGGRGNGYGSMKVAGKVIDTHVVSYQLYKGEIPKGKMVCHTCDVRNCVNPDHLFLGSAKNNFDDAVAKNRIKTGANKTPIESKKHPSSSAYAAGCRCDKCKKYRVEYIRQWRLKNK
jgi:hypothetical protein